MPLPPFPRRCNKLKAYQPFCYRPSRRHALTDPHHSPTPEIAADTSCGTELLRPRFQANVMLCPKVQDNPVCSYYFFWICLRFPQVLILTKMWMPQNLQRFCILPSVTSTNTTSTYWLSVFHPLLTTRIHLTVHSSIEGYSFFQRSSLKCLF